MFDINRNVSMGILIQDQSMSGQDATLRYKAIMLFNQSLWRGYTEKIISMLLNRSCALWSIDSQPGLKIDALRYGGIRSVAINKIRGSFGRSHDFDIYFHPLHELNRHRWASIAMARLQQIPLEPVSLVKVAEFYFVQDGHHRVSVARALGEENVYAEIMVIEMRQPLMWGAPQVRQGATQLAAGNEA
jgi:hypothetical protein